MMLKKIIYCCMASVISVALSAQPQVVAHRGFYMTKGSHENTLSSLKNAQKLGPAGVEFDVHMTADDSLVVHHNQTIPGTKVDIQKSTFEQVRAVVLPEGHQVPTLKEFLRQAKKTPDLKLFLEIKTHYSAAREMACVHSILQVVEEFGMFNQIQFISFSDRTGKEVIRLRPDATVVFVSSNIAAPSPSELHAMGYKGVSYELNVFMNHPSYVDEARALGMETTLWMVEDPEVADWAIRHGITYMSTDYPDKMLAYMSSIKAFSGK